MMTPVSCSPSPRRGRRLLGPTRRARPRAANSGRQCFLARQVNGYTSVSDQIVDVKVAANRYFRSGSTVLPSG